MSKGTSLATAMPPSSSSRHRQFKDRAKVRVDDLQEMFSGLQSARKESRAADAAILEEQVHLMLREWRAELSEPSSSASSLLGNDKAASDPVSETLRLLQLAVEEEDDATSKLSAAQQQPAAAGNEGGEQNLKEEEVKKEEVGQQQGGSGAGGQGGQGDGGVASAVFNDQTYYVNQELSVEDFLFGDEYKINLPTGGVLNHLAETSQVDYQQFNMSQELPYNAYVDINGYEQNGGDIFFHMPDLLTTMCPQPSAFLKPKCALWDCPRPSQGSERCQDYCSIYHADLAMKEDSPLGTAPVIRPRGIDLKDGPLFAALAAKIQGKNIGIPVCQGAATAKSPWNAPELFDLCVFEGESIREWLFFDKPRRAFESGNRKQRSLPDYNGRGWHESRKQIVKEVGGLKRSYYMDPQPLSNFEWHLYEYEIPDCDTFALYRLEFKVSDGKKAAKAKSVSIPLVDLQQQMVRLSANSPVENKRSTRGRGRITQKDTTSMNTSANTTSQGNAPNAYAIPGMNQLTFVNESTGYRPEFQYPYPSTTERSDFYWNPSEGT